MMSVVFRVVRERRWRWLYSIRSHAVFIECVGPVPRQFRTFSLNRRRVQYSVSSREHTGWLLRLRLLLFHQAGTPNPECEASCLKFMLVGHSCLGCFMFLRGFRHFFSFSHHCRAVPLPVVSGHDGVVVYLLHIVFSNSVGLKAKSFL